MLSAAEDIMSKQSDNTDSTTVSPIVTRSYLTTTINHNTDFLKTTLNYDKYSIFKDSGNTSDVCLSDISNKQCEKTSTAPVLLADILPALVVKLIFPYFVHRIPYGVRNALICIFQVLAYITVAFSTNVPIAILGVVFAAIGSGWGEITYLSLSSNYHPDAILAWSSGTGAAGLIGSFAYAALTEPNWADISPKNTCLIMLIVPIVFAFAYWFLLKKDDKIQRAVLWNITTWIIKKETHVDIEDNHFKHNNDINVSKHYDLTMKESFKIIISMIKYMIPLGSVYFFEYLINQGLTSLIVFDCASGFSLSQASQYRWFQDVYQVGVFISRSSIKCFRMPYPLLWFLSAFQFAMLSLFILESMFSFIPHISIVFILILLEGLIGGAAYVNTFDQIHRTTKEEEKEFALSVATQGDCIGITLSGFIAIPIHNVICDFSLRRK